MKRYLIIIGLSATLAISTNSCQKSAFDEYYRNPSTVTEATVERLFSGMIYSYRQLIVPDYGNLFVTLRPTVFRYLHITGWINEANQLLPGGAAIEDRWTRYYEGLAQYRELETLYNSTTEAERAEKRIFYLAAKVLFYDQTQQAVDLFGDIPWTQAGMLSTHKSDYQSSYPAYDHAQDIYTAMLDDLKTISDELRTITLSQAMINRFNTQDVINGGDVSLWEKYCNSLRVRMLMRVSESPDFASRATQELAEIIGSPTTYPLITTNAENAQLDIYNIDDNSIQTKGIEGAFEAEGWYANLASKRMIDHMVTNEDPRLPFIFEPGAEADGQFIGLDQSLTSSQQRDMATGGTLSIFNRSTISRNQYFAGILFSATETNLLLAEYYDQHGNAAGAKTAFETAVNESIDLYRDIRAASNNDVVPAAPDPTPTQKHTYLANLDWDGASDKIQLIATQKWIHFGIIQTVQAWSEIRRHDYPTFEYRIQNSDLQKTVPVKFNLPPSEQTYNLENYNAVRDQDNINTKLFWDIN